MKRDSIVYMSLCMGISPPPSLNKKKRLTACIRVPAVLNARSRRTSTNPRPWSYLYPAPVLEFSNVDLCARVETATAERVEPSTFLSLVYYVAANGWGFSSFSGYPEGACRFLHTAVVRSHLRAAGCQKDHELLSHEFLSSAASDGHLRTSLASNWHMTARMKAGSNPQVNLHKMSTLLLSRIWTDLNIDEGLVRELVSHVCFHKKLSYLELTGRVVAISKLAAPFRARPETQTG